MKFNGKPVEPGAWRMTEQVLAAYNEQAGSKLRLLTSAGQPSEAAKRVYSRVRTYPDIGLDEFADIIRRTLASHWWGDEPPTIGVVFGPKVFEDNITRQPTKRGKRLSEKDTRLLEARERARRAWEDDQGKESA